MTSRTVSGSVNTTSLIAGGDMPCAESSTICARRHVTTDPDVRCTIRSSRLPSSLVISRNCTLAAIAPPGRVAISTQGLRRQHHHPSLWKPANIAGEPTSTSPTGTPNGTPASETATLHLNGPPAINRSYTRRAFKLTGRLTNSQSQPITDATLDVLQQIAGTTTLA